MYPAAAAAGSAPPLLVPTRSQHQRAQRLPAAAAQGTAVVHHSGNRPALATHNLSRCQLVCWPYPTSVTKVHPISGSRWLLPPQYRGLGKVPAQALPGHVPVGRRPPISQAVIACNGLTPHSRESASAGSIGCFNKGTERSLQRSMPWAPGCQHTTDYVLRHSTLCVVTAVVLQHVLCCSESCKQAGQAKPWWGLQKL
jgi:hypothetical protein